MTVTRVTVPSCSKTWVEPTLRPKMPGWVFMARAAESTGAAARVKPCGRSKRRLGRNGLVDTLGASCFKPPLSSERLGAHAYLTQACRVGVRVSPDRPPRLSRRRQRARSLSNRRGRQGENAGVPRCRREATSGRCAQHVYGPQGQLQRRRRTHL